MRLYETKCKVGTVYIEDGIIWEIQEASLVNLEMSMDTIETITNNLIDKINGKKLLLVDMRNVKKQTAESRKFVSTDPSTKIIDKVALLTNNPISKTIANFFMGINKPLIEIKMFSNKQNAVNWLKEK
ncbi:MAG: STAS/SEC14 domain-containing protein [Nitrospirae bacterium]|nr:STAS/SEC14 domain-containing protein [Nitrospirota bacterium]